MRYESRMQQAALLVGGVFVLVGIAGFIPGITTDAPGDFAGEESDAELLGIFTVSVLHSLVHVGFGLAGMALAHTRTGARNYLIGGGAIYLALGVLGLVGALDWLPADDSDDWLHLALGIGLVGLGLLLRNEVRGDRGVATTY